MKNNVFFKFKRNVIHEHQMIYKTTDLEIKYLKGVGVGCEGVGKC
jgi:hypothetical protein